MPERLEPNTIDTISVVLSDLPADLSADLQELFAITFKEEEYLLFQAAELFQNGTREAANLLVKRIDEKQRHGEIIRLLPPLRINLALYVALEPSASERLQQLREVVEEIGSRLGMLNPYGCVLKQHILGEENALAMDHCVEVCKAGPNRFQIPILLVNRGLGITIDLPLKATVRYLHILSRNSRLKGYLYGRTELVTSIAMLEYDDEDSVSLQQQIAKLQNELEGKSFSKSQMSEAVRSLTDAALERLRRNDLIRLSQFPIRTDAIGTIGSFLFGRKKLHHALNDTAETLAAVYQANVQERFCDGCFQANGDSNTLFEVLESFPVPYIRSQLKTDLTELGRKYAQTYEPHVPKLRICLGEKKLRAQMEEQYQKALERSCAYIRYVVIRELGKQANAYITSKRLDMRENDLNEKIARLKTKARAVGNAQNAVDFLQTQLAFLSTQGGVQFKNEMNRDMIMLISERIDDTWDQYESYMPASPKFDIYNYGTLEDQELQALQIMRFNAELYQRNRELIFQIG